MIYSRLLMLLLGCSLFACSGNTEKRPDLVDEDQRLKLYWPDSSRQFYANAFCALRDGGFAITGRAQKEKAPTRDFLLLLDADGRQRHFQYLEPLQQRDALGRQYIYRGTEGMAITETPSGDLLIASKALRGNLQHQNSLLHLMRPDGQSRHWALGLNNVYRTSPRALALFQEDAFLLVENIIDLPAVNSPSGQARRTDEIQVHRIRYDKLTVWSKRFASRKQESQLAYDALVLPDESSLVLGASQTEQGYDYLMVNFNQQGEASQAMVFDFSFLAQGNRGGYSLALSQDDHLLMGGLQLGQSIQHQLFKLAATGDTLWHRAVGGSPRSYPQVGETESGLYVLAGANLKQEAYAQFYQPDGQPLRQDQLLNLGYTVEVRDLQWQNGEAYLLGNAQHPQGRQFFIWRPRIPQANLQ